MPAPRTTVCLLLCLSFVPTAWAARLAMEQTEGDSQRAFVLHEGGNMHTDQAALRERRARAYEIEQQEAFDELMFAKYAITGNTWPSCPYTSSKPCRPNWPSSTPSLPIATRMRTRVC